MKVTIVKAFAFRAAGREEVENDRRRYHDDPAALGCIGLPRFVNEEDVRHLLWCDSGLCLMLRQLAARMPDHCSLRGDRLPPFDDVADSHINDPEILRARFRHLFFGDIPHDLDLRKVRIQRDAEWVKCRYGIRQCT